MASVVPYCRSLPPQGFLPSGAFHGMVIPFFSKWFETRKSRKDREGDGRFLNWGTLVLF